MAMTHVGPIDPNSMVGKFAAAKSAAQGGGPVNTTNTAYDRVFSTGSTVTPSVSVSPQSAGGSSGGIINDIAGIAMGSVGKIGEFDPNSLMGKAMDANKKSRALIDDATKSTLSGLTIPDTFKTTLE